MRSNTKSPPPENEPNSPTMEEKTSTTLDSKASRRISVAPKRLGNLATYESSGSDEEEGQGKKISDDDRDGDYQQNEGSRSQLRKSQKVQPESTKESLQADVSRLSTAIESLRAGKIDLYKAHQNLKHDRAAVWKRYEQERKAKMEFKSQIQKLQANIGDISEEMRDQAKMHTIQLAEKEKRITEILQEANARPRNEVINALPDDITREHFKRLKLKWRSWARKWANPSLDGIDHSAIRDTLGIACSKHFSAAFENVFQAFLECSSAPSILLNIVVAFDMCDRILKRHFFRINGCSLGESSPVEAEELLFEIWKYAEAKDETKANLWRAQTAQLLQLADRGNPPPTEIVQLNLILDDFYNFEANRMEERGSPFLRETSSSEAMERHEELMEIFHEAGGMASRLSIQKTRISTLELPKRQFKIKSEFMDPHASMLLEDDDHQYDRSYPQIIVEPMVVAYGNESGQNYGNRKTWMKATVLILKEYKDDTKTAKPSPPGSSLDPTAQEEASSATTQDKRKDRGNPDVEDRSSKKAKLKIDSDLTEIMTHAIAVPSGLLEQTAHDSESLQNPDLSDFIASAPDMSTQKVSRERDTQSFTPEAQNSSLLFEQLKEAASECGSATNRDDESGCETYTPLREQTSTDSAEESNAHSLVQNQVNSPVHKAQKSTLQEGTQRGRRASVPNAAAVPQNRSRFNSYNYILRSDSEMYDVDSLETDKTKKLEADIEMNAEGDAGTNAAGAAERQADDGNGAADEGGKEGKSEGRHESIPKQRRPPSTQ